MGQQSSLNCGTSTKQHKFQIETTGQNVLQINKNPKNAVRDSQVHIDYSKNIKKTSLKGDSLSTSEVMEYKNAPNYLPDHQSLTKVDSKPFQNSQLHPTKQSLFMEPSLKTLAEIISPRHNTTMHFPMSQVVGLIQSLTYSLAYMSRCGFFHHDFYPTNVSYHNGIFKVKNPKLIQCSGYQLTKQRRRFSFLSPELIQEALNGTQQIHLSEEILDKGDIFAIGMILLEFCTLQPSSQCYDEQSYSIVDRIKTLYSPEIADCVRQMLVYDQAKRKNAKQISLLVFMNSQHEKQIALERETQQENRLTTNVNPPQRQMPQQPMTVTSPEQIRNSFQSGPQQTSNIVVSTPNYVYSRIGPNNQGLLSPSTLTNKLKVIQRIHQNPAQQDDEGTPSKGGAMKRPFEQINGYPQNILQNKQISQPIDVRDQIGYQAYRDQFLKPSSGRPSQQLATKYSFATTSNEVRPQSTALHNTTRYVTSSPRSTQHIQDRDSQTLEQRVERVLQMSRNIK